MLIECPTCEAKVHAKVLAEREYAFTEESEPCKYVFLECPSCNGPLLGFLDWIQLSELERIQHSIDEVLWSRPIRLWPRPQKSFDWSVPQQVQRSFEDAQKCFQARVYTACAVMCGRALEAICKEKTGETTLSKGLKKLRESNQIDGRLFDWGEALRKERNIGAHAGDETVTKNDAQDILDFANAIIEYIYVMSKKFEAYQARKAEIEASKKKPID